MKTAQIPPGTIVVGVDGSPSSDEALEWAVEQARLEHRALTLAHGLGSGTTTWLDQPGLDRGRILEYMHADGEEVLQRAVDMVARKAPSVEVHTVLRMIDPRVVLIDLSAGAAMTVLGSRGRGPVRSLLLGSVGLAVSEHASCPVVVFRPHKVGSVRHGILVGVDGTERSQSAVEFAYRQASLRSLPLTVLHCFWDIVSATTGAAYVQEGEDGLEARRLVLAEAVSGMAEKFPDVHVELTLGRGLADDCLVRASERMDLVVVGTHPTKRISGLVYGDIGRGVVEHAPCVVAVVPDPAA